MKDIVFRDICDSLRVGMEVEFQYKWRIYGIINWDFTKNGKGYWFFLCDEIELMEEICEFHDIAFLLDWVAHRTIDGITIREIFDTWLYDEDNLWF